MTTLDQAIAQMRAAGMPELPNGHPLLNTDRVVRYGPKGKAWYRLWEYVSHNGRRYITGAFGLWGMVPSTRVEANFEGMDVEERASIEQTQRDQEAAERQKRADRARAASLRARAQWQQARAAVPAGVPTYLDHKGVEHAKGLRYLPDGTLLVPMIRYDVTEAAESAEGYAGPRRLIGLQKIAPDGAKRFNKGMAKEGAACRLGNTPKADAPLLITEGLATGLSIAKALEHRYTVFVVFDAGNILPAAKILRALYPQSPVIFCADDDAYLESSLNKLLRENFHLQELVRLPVSAARFRGEVKGAAGWASAELEISADWVTGQEGVPGIVGAVKHGDRLQTLVRENAGRKYAHAAAQAIGNAAVVFPVFADRALPAEPDCVKLTDFNDLHQAEGLHAVRAQLQAELERIALSQQVRALVREEVSRKRKTKDAGGKPGKPVGLASVFKRFVLIYPSQTAWDETLQQIVKVADMRLAIGDGVVKHWLGSPDRRTVNIDQLVFDPTQTCDPGCVNLFRGMPLAPSDKGSCAKLRELLQFLCGEADQDIAPATEWVLKWLAYPLQHPGAKMQTALVIHGPEGTGKNLFFSAVRAIYGEYGSLITQTELEDSFNGWLSRRLFLIANEVISRQELRHHVGKIKNLVTESPLPIREMYAPIRYEDNHANIVFLTNELHALQMSPGDRRFMVIRTPKALSAEFYAGIAAELAAGGAGALYRYLLDYDLGDFTEHTKPLATEAKEALIEQGLNSAQHFWRDLKEERIGLPYVPCFVRDLYQAYGAWAADCGHKHTMPINRFSSEFMAMNGVTRKCAERLPDPDRPEEWALPAGKRPQRAVFVMGPRPDVDDEKLWLSQGVKEFRIKLREFLDQRGLPGRRREHANHDGWFEGAGDVDQ